MADIAEELAALRKRVEALEDEKAVQALLTRYGLAADAEDGDRLAALYTEDCFVDIDQKLVMNGRAEVRALSDSPSYEDICAHLMGPFEVALDGERATATGYATFYMRVGEEVRIWRQSCSRWDLVKEAGAWRILRRVSRAVGQPEARALFGAALDARAAGA
jgi:uncharacterized protein (TIGR02246 family)